MYRVAFQTLGCRLNQLETEAVAAAFSKAGFQLVPWKAEAELYLVNSCTVTSKADQKTRRFLRQALRSSSRSAVLVTGCYAQLEAPALAELFSELMPKVSRFSPEEAEGRFTVLPGDRKAELLDLPAFLVSYFKEKTDGQTLDIRPAMAAWASHASLRLEPFRFFLSDFSFHSRASLKIQDGCDNKCAYCRVRIARGPSVSLAAAEVEKRLRILEERGYAEAVLTGVNVCSYRDPDGGGDFSSLLTRLLAATSVISLRLSSIEPHAVNEAFTDIVSHERVRPYFHISLQAASASVLRRMRRPYDAPFVARLIERLRRAKGDPFLACDIIAGFPGETEDDFNSALTFCRENALTAVHAFPYSPRPGTEALNFRPLVPERVAVERVARLSAYARAARRAYAERWRGRVVRAIAETSAGARKGTAALTENYLSVLLTDPGLKAGQEYRCRLRLSDDPSLGGADFDAQADIVSD